MSEDEEFQSAEKECFEEIVNVNSFKSYSLSPRKKGNQHGVNWKFEKIKNLAPTSVSSKKPDTKNISFQTQDLAQISDQSDGSDRQQHLSAFTSMYRNHEQVYEKQKTMGTNWLGNRQYFASIFVDPASLARSAGSLFKQINHQKLIKKNQCYFDSDFESGNLCKTYKVGKHQYDLILQNDINTKGNTQWFYFRIRNIPAKTKIKLNIVNMLKSDSLFNYGMQPCILSTEAFKKYGQSWFRTGSSIKYSRNNMKVEGTKRFYHTLSFIISTPYQGDVLKVAQCYPYTLQNLNYFLDTVEKKYSKKNLLKRQFLGETLAKNQIQALRITQQNPRRKQPKSIIVVTARQHPGETPGSLVCEGFIEFVLSDEKQAQYLRKNYEIIVIPMLNPDGVMVGNYRTNLCGLDLNRRWDGSKAKQAYELQLVKKYLMNTVKNRKVSFIIDLHGHSRKLFSFFYGNTGVEGPESVRLFPYICSKISSNMIRFEDCTFNEQQSKLRTARIQLNIKYKTTNIFTFESSFFGYYGKDRQKVHFNQEHYKSLGQILAKGMFMHERYIKNPENSDVQIVRKYFNDLKKKPQLIQYGQKIGSGSETQPEQCEIEQRDYGRISENRESKKGLDRKKQKRCSKKQIMVKEISKPSRQLHVMDIARVNSIFPNDILALMPSSYGGKQKLKSHFHTFTQTIEIPFIKIYDLCKVKDLHEEMTLKNQSLVEKQKSNLFRSSLRPKSSSNTYLQLPPNISPGKRQIRRRHDSGIETKLRQSSKNKKVSVYVQTLLTFNPSTILEEKQKYETIISPPKIVEGLKKKSHFATLDPDKSESNKRSIQSFKIGLRALNIETWRIKKKNFQ